jgi:hypothetical protein
MHGGRRAVPRNGLPAKLMRGTLPKGIGRRISGFGVAVASGRGALVGRACNGRSGAMLGRAPCWRDFCSSG